jgi:hypothetical protein
MPMKGELGFPATRSDNDPAADGDTWGKYRFLRDSSSNYNVVLLRRQFHAI